MPPYERERDTTNNPPFMSSMLVRPLETDPASIAITAEMLSLPAFMAAAGKDFLSLGAGSPATAEALAPFLPQLHVVWNELGNEFFQDPSRWAGYPPPEGILELRKLFAEKANRDLDITDYYDAEDIVVTSGGQQALDIIRDAFALPGDVVFTAAPSYLGALANFENSSVAVAGVEIDSDGMTPEGLRKQVLKARELRKRPRFIYINPTLANPSGEIMSAVRRRDIYEVARELDLIIVEDDPYRNIQNPDVFVPLPIAAIDNEYPQSERRVIYVNSESKEFAPGVRAGYICCKDPIVRERFVRLKTVKDLGSPLIIQRLLARILSDQQLVEKITASYGKVSYERQLLMLTALRELNADKYLTWTQAQGGLFFYVTALDPRISMSQIREELHEDHEAAEIVAGPACFPSENEFNPSPPDTSARLNFTAVKREKISEAVRRFIAKLEAKHRELNSLSFAGGGSDTTGSQPVQVFAAIIN